MNKYEKRIEQLTKFGRDPLPKNLNTLSDSQLDQVETDLGYSLPVQYRDFLKEYGGLFIGSGIEIPNPNHKTPAYAAAEGFYAVNPHQPSADLVTNYRRRGVGWPKNLLPICVGENGSICLVVEGNEKGFIYFWNSGATGGDPVPENIHFVSSSFDDFIDLLEPRT